MYNIGDIVVVNFPKEGVINKQYHGCSGVIKSVIKCIDSSMEYLVKFEKDDIIFNTYIFQENELLLVK